MATSTKLMTVGELSIAESFHPASSPVTRQCKNIVENFVVSLYGNYPVSVSIFLDQSLSYNSTWGGGEGGVLTKV